jgi:K+-sensing histidine kinase KdpD
MFDLHANDSNAVANSELSTRKEREAMDPSKNSMINCPTMLTGMSHEMRTHMNAIVAFSFLMKENCGNESDREEFSKQILSSCDQLMGLFDSFLDTAIIETGNSKADAKVYRLDSILNDLFTDFREVISKEGPSGLELITEIRYSNSIGILIDRNKISRIIRSLFQNSVKNTQTGYIKIGYYFKDEKVTFYVLDSGQGYFKCKEFLHTEDLNESLLIHNDTYTAINITLAKKLIQMLGGTFWIECNGLTGAGIYFSIPSKTVESTDINENKFVNTMIAI